MMHHIRISLCCLLLLMLPASAQAAGDPTFERLYVSDEPIRAVLSAQEGTVLAVVDEFPILEEDVDFTISPLF